MKALFTWSYTLKCFYILLSAVVVVPVVTPAQNIYVKFASGPHWLAFDGPGRLAGAGWQLPGFNNSGWKTPLNGAGCTLASGNGGCPPANTSAFHNGDTCIWTKAYCKAVDTGCFRYEFTLPQCGCIDTALFQVGVDDNFRVWINGNLMGVHLVQGSVSYDLTPAQMLAWLHPGKNVMAVEGYNVLQYCAYFFSTAYIRIDTAGCTLKDTIAVCKGQNAVLNPGNIQGSFLWSNGDTSKSITVDTPGVYQVQITTPTCGISYETATLTNPILINIHLGNDTSICQGQNIILNAGNKGNTFVWNTGATTQTIPVMTSGTYWVNVDSANCIGSDTIKVKVNPVPLVNIGNDTSICNGQSVLLNARNTGSTFMWNTGATTQTITVDTTGKYWVQVDDNNCISSDTLTIAIKPVPIVSFNNDTSVCDGQSILLNAANTGGTFLWNTGANTQTIPVSTKGKYWVRVTAANNCTGTDTINVTIKPLPSIDLRKDTLVCNGLPITLYAGHADSIYLWNTGARSDTISVSMPGTYWVLVQGNNKCIATDSIVVTYNTYPTVNLGPDQIVCFNTAVMLNAAYPNATYLWSNGSTASNITVSDTGTYWVNVSNICGVRSDTIHITPNPECDCYFVIPNAFSPNNDGINDIYKPISNCPFGHYVFRIYNRWGEMIFETSDPKVGWDGMYKGQHAQLDVYVWYIQYNEHNESARLLKGNVTLLR